MKTEWWWDNRKLAEAEITEPYGQWRCGSCGYVHVIRDDVRLILFYYRPDRITVDGKQVWPNDEPVRIEGDWDSRGHSYEWIPIPPTLRDRAFHWTFEAK
jgi:hypothetical protein